MSGVDAAVATCPPKRTAACPVALASMIHTHPGRRRAHFVPDWTQLAAANAYTAQLDLLGMSFPWEQGRQREKVVPGSSETLGGMVGVK